jgi:cytochrome c biogenesis protein CcdA/thiol-disulfide isomerase/thioredoxin
VPLLLAFAFIAGFATCLTPCVLPVLPAVLSGAATGGRRRPLGIVTGLVLSFTFATVALVYVIAALGLPNDVVRSFAVAVLLVFGISLLVPPIAARLEAWLSRLGHVSPRTSANGFFSGLLLGFSLGFLYAPCAGPILAGVITVSAAQSFTAARLAVALAYGLGSALVLYLYMLGGRRLTRRLVGRSVRIQQALGALMVLVAVLVYAQLDIRFQTAVASKLPDFLTQPAQELQQSSAVAKALGNVSGHGVVAERGIGEAESGHRLPVLGKAPDFVGTQQWFNTPGDRPLTLAGLRGQVVLVDFWTYTCINCIRTFPHLKALYDKYHRDGFTIVGVHSPEFPFEKEAGNVADAIAQNGLPYPVVQDNEHETWNAYRNQFWPADYLIDAQGRIRYVHFGEGDYGASEKAVRSLLHEAGRRKLGGVAHFHVQRPSLGTATPESYLGADRAQGFVNGPIVPGSHDFGSAPNRLTPNELAYGGRWTMTGEAATAGPRAELNLNFTARRVFIVLGAPRGPRSLRVLIDGKPIPERWAGSDVRGGAASVAQQRLYRLVNLPKVEHHILTLKFAPGISGYALTFG